jgi:phosphohistidine swiveling domain-containing protein
MKSIKLRLKDYKKFFISESKITCLHSEFLMKGSLGIANPLVTYRNGVFGIFIDAKKEKLCLDKGVEIYGKQDKFNQYISEFKEYLDFADNDLILRYSKVPKRMTKKEFEEAIISIGALWYYYGIAEFSYQDLAYGLARKNNDKISERNLEEAGRLKLDRARNTLNAFFFKNGVIENILKYISNKVIGGQDARYLFSDEILDAFDGKKLGKYIKDIINERKRCYGAAAINGKIIKLSYKEALKINKEIMDFDMSTVIKGKTANRGIARGRAIIAPMLDDPDKIKKIDRLMKKGDILIAETTSPDLIMLCRKASAIVADQGGMLSHAAIISRELGIPCIIQTENATRILKTGDLIEVDADKGIVRKIVTSK